MDMKDIKTGKWILTIILLCFMVSSFSEAAQETQVTAPLQPGGGIINSQTKPQGINQPILGQPSSSSSVNQPLTGLNQPLTGFNQPSSTGPNQPILGQPSSSSSLNQPLTGFNQPSSTGLNQPIFGQPSSSSVNQPITGFNQPSSTGINQPILGQPSSSSSVNQPLTGFNQPSSTQNQPFTNRLNQNSLSGIPFANGNLKLEVSITKIVFTWIALLLALHGTDRN